VSTASARSACLPASNRIFANGTEDRRELLYGAAAPEDGFLAFTNARNAPAEAATADIRRPA